jgi:hypothetical protein
MRGRKAWLNMLALFAFVLAQVPASVVASLCAPVKCEMPCCQGKQGVQPAHLEHSQESASPSMGHCESKEMEHPCRQDKPAKSITSKSSDGCGCVIKSGSNPELPTATLAVSSSPTSSHVDALVPPAPVVVATIILSDVQPGIVGADSGPPNSRPYCVWQGRAPPVFLA